MVMATGPRLTVQHGHDGDGALAEVSSDTNVAEAMPESGEKHMRHGGRRSVIDVGGHWFFFALWGVVVLDFVCVCGGERDI